MRAGLPYLENKYPLDVIRLNAIRNLSEKYQTKVVVFEATCFYSRRLETYLVNNGLHYHLLNPLVAKKRLDNESRLRKNNRLDATRRLKWCWIYRVIQFTFATFTDEFELITPSTLKFLKYYPHSELLSDRDLPDLEDKIRRCHLRSIGEVCVKNYAKRLFQSASCSDSWFLKNIDLRR